MTVLDFNSASLQANTTGYTFPISNKFYGYQIRSGRSLEGERGRRGGTQGEIFLARRRQTAQKTARLSLRVRYTSRGARRGLLQYQLKGTP